MVANETRTGYLTIAGTGSHEIVIKKSRFICTVGRATSEDEARVFIDGLRQRYWDANHNCSAYIVGERSQFQRSSDDGEPSGTAGMPMLEVLKRRELTDTVAVVTRYFGGTMLGAGGLIRAYGQAVSEAINAVGVVERKPLTVLAVEASHQDAGRLENALRNTEYQLGPVTYEHQVSFEMYLDAADIPGFGTWLAETTSGRGRVRVTGERFVEVPVEG